MTPPAPLPALWEYTAPPEWTAVDFISDLHLSEETPATFEAWAGHLRRTSASAVFILGDLFDIWVGDEARLSGFEARCAEVLAETSSRLVVGFMAGNRDFLVGCGLMSDCGLLALPDPAVLVAFGERLILSHGDALCLEDHEYQRFRAVVRSSEWQRDFLAQPLSRRRAEGMRLRSLSEQRKSTKAPADWADVDRATAVRWMHEAGTPTLIHGHTHRPQHEDLAPGFAREVLSDWDLDHARPGRAQVLRLRRSGLTRISPE
jgi:UDP-2,3-diacylglucosamine hydrolase